MTKILALIFAASLTLSATAAFAAPGNSGNGGNSSNGNGNSGGGNGSGVGGGNGGQGGGNSGGNNGGGNSGGGNSGGGNGGGSNGGGNSGGNGGHSGGSTGGSSTSHSGSVGAGSSVGGGPAIETVTGLNLNQADTLDAYHACRNDHIVLNILYVNGNFSYSYSGVVAESVRFKQCMQAKGFSFGADYSNLQNWAGKAVQTRDIQTP